MIVELRKRSCKWSTGIRDLRKAHSEKWACMGGLFLEHHFVGGIVLAGSCKCLYPNIVFPTLSICVGQEIPLHLKILSVRFKCNGIFS